MDKANTQSPNNKKLATIAGLSALVAWALSPLLISELTRIPAFQLSAILFFIAFFYSGMTLTFNKQWNLIRKVPTLFYWGALTILINQIAYIYAIKFAPPEQVEIIYYLWPILVLLSSMLFFKHKKSILPLISACLGLAGVYVLLTDGTGRDSISLEYSLGYFFAFAAAIAWVVYPFSRAIIIPSHQK